MKKTNVTLVSIHVRLGDYEAHLRKKFNLGLVSASYFMAAADILTRKFEVFII